MELPTNDALPSLQLQKVKLKYFDFSAHRLLTLPIKSSLSILDIDHSYIQQIDLSQQSKLKELCLENDYNLNVLDLKNNSELSVFSIKGIGNDLDWLTHLNLGGNTLLHSLELNIPFVSEMNLSNKRRFTHLLIGQGNLTYLDVSIAENLVYLFVGTNRISQIDISTSESIEYFEAKDNALICEAIEALKVQFSNNPFFDVDDEACIAP